MVSLHCRLWSTSSAEGIKIPRQGRLSPMRADKGLDTVPESVIAGTDIGGIKTAVVLSRKLPDTACQIEFPTCPEAGERLGDVTALCIGAAEKLPGAKAMTHAEVKERE